MILQFLLAALAAVLLWKGFMVLMAMSPRTKASIHASWMLVTLGAFGVVVSPLFTVAAVPAIPVGILLAGEAGLAIFSRRTALP